MIPADMHRRAVDYLRGLQDRITAGLEQADGAGKFREDSWQREGGGGGRSRVMIEGGVFEKAGVNFSEVFGEMSPEFAKRSEEHTSELQSLRHLVCRLLLEKKKK